MAYFAQLYRIIEYICVPRAFSEGLALKSAVIESSVISALDGGVPGFELHFSVSSSQRFAAANIGAQRRGCECVLVATVEVPATCQASTYNAAEEAQRTACRPTSS